MDEMKFKMELMANRTQLVGDAGTYVSRRTF